MSYADSLLSTGERVTHRVRQHWLDPAVGRADPDRGDHRGVSCSSSSAQNVTGGPPGTC